MLSYTLNLVATNPMGSTNYGKLTNVSLQFTASNDAILAFNSSGDPYEIVKGAPLPQTYEIIVVGVNHNIIRISGGKNLGVNHNITLSVPSTVGCLISCRMYL